MIRAATIALLLAAGITLAEGVVQESGRQVYIFNGSTSKITCDQDGTNTIAFWANDGGGWIHYANVSGTQYSNAVEQAWANNYYNLTGGNIEWGYNGSTYFTGSMSGFFMSTQDASAAEIRALASYRGSTNFNGQAVSYPHAIQPDLTSVPDRSSAGNDGTPTDLTWGAGVGAFDGSDDYVSSTTLGGFGNSLDAGGASIAFWVKSTYTNDIRFACGTKNVGLTTFFSVVVNYNYALGANAPGYIGLALRDDDSLVLQASANADAFDGAWHHAVITTTPSAQTATIYLDGSPLSVGYGTRNTVDNWSNFAFPFYWGAQNNAGSLNLPFECEMSNARIYDDVLTSNEVATLYAAGMDAPADAISTNNLVLFYDFEADKENKLVLALGPTAASYSTGDSITNGTLILDTSLEANHGTATDVTVGGVR